MMKYIFSLFFLITSLSVNAQTKMSELFKEMPDSLIPLLTKNNRLDMIDFREAKMKAVVTNLLEGDSEMTFLSDDSLSIRMNEALNVDMFLAKTEDEYDGFRTVICMKNTYLLSSAIEKENVLSYYSWQWRPLSHPRLLKSYKAESTVLSKDNELVSKEICR